MALKMKALRQQRNQRRSLIRFIELLEQRNPLAAISPDVFGDDSTPSETSSQTSQTQSFEDVAWVHEGPFGVHHASLQNLVGGNFIGGVAQAVLAHPGDSDTLYAGTVGGVWKSTNATSPLPRWTSQTDSLSISALAFDPTDSSSETLVASTGGFSSLGVPAMSRGRVYRTIDGGDTWADPGSQGIVGENLSGIAARGDTIVVSSADSGGGIFRSTDGGANFTAIQSADFTDDNFAALVEDPTDVNRVYAASTGNPGVSNSGGVYRSDDFGLTWTKITGTAIDPEMEALVVDAAQLELAVSPQTGRLYVAILLDERAPALFHTNTGDTAAPTWTRMDLPVTRIGGSRNITSISNTTPIVITSPQHGLTNDNDFLDSVFIRGLSATPAANGFHAIEVIDEDRFRLLGTQGNGSSTNVGQWQRVAFPSPIPRIDASSLGQPHFSMVVDPADENILYVGGDRHVVPNEIGATSVSNALFRGDASIAGANTVPSPQWDHLTNQSVNFDEAGGTANNSAPPRGSHALVFDASGNLILASDGGVYSHSSPQDNTGDWHSLVGDLGAMEVHSVGYDGSSNTIVAASPFGTIYQRWPGGSHWEVETPGEAGRVFVDDPRFRTSIHYSSSGQLESFRRSTWGMNAVSGSEAFPALEVTSGPDYVATATTPVAANRSSRNFLLFAMANGLYESLDRGETLSQIAPDILVSQEPYGLPIVYGSDENTIEGLWVGDTSGNVHIRFNSFTMTDPDPTSDAAILDLVADRDARQIVAIDEDSVFSRESGTWVDLTENLSSLGATGFRSLAYAEPIAVSATGLFLGTENGIFFRQIDQSGWTRLDEFPAATVTDLEYDNRDNILVVGTMGQGVWTLRNALDGRAGTVDVEEVDGDLVINTMTSAAVHLTIQADAANQRYNLTFPNADVSVTNVAGATQVGTTVFVPFASVTDSVLFSGDIGGDSVTLDLSLGEFPVPIGFDGGSSHREDELRIIGTDTYAQQTIEFTEFNTGSVVVGNSTLNFTGAHSIISEVQSIESSIRYSLLQNSLVVAPSGAVEDQMVIDATRTSTVRLQRPHDSLDIDATNEEADNTTRLFGSFDLEDTSLRIAGGEMFVDGANVFSQAGSIEIEGQREMVVDVNTRLQTVGGAIRLTGNQRADSFFGRDGLVLDGAILSTASGDIVVTGFGDNSNNASDLQGVVVLGDTVIESVTGDITLEGTGGRGQSFGNDRMHGVQLASPAVRIRSVDGNITLRGTGGTAPFSVNQGVVVEGTIETTGTGNITLEGIGGEGSGGGNIGVSIVNAGTSITAAQGEITVVGNGGVSSTNFNYGVEIASGAEIRSTGATAAAITINGTGGTGDDVNHGVNLQGGLIVSSAGAVTINGTGGTADNDNYGVNLSGANITLDSGSLSVNGTGGGGGALSFGVHLNDGTRIESTGTGSDAATISITGQGGTGVDVLYGINMRASEILSVSGDVSLQGTAGDGTGPFNMGVLIGNGSSIKSTGSGTQAPIAAKISVVGKAGAGTENNHGISIFDAEVTSVFGDVLLDGTGGDGTGLFNIGVRVGENTRLESTGSGADAANVILNGTGGDGTNSHRGIQFSGGPTPSVTANDGDVSLVGVGGAVGSFSQGVMFFSGRVMTLGSGDLLIDGTATAAPGVFLQGGAIIEATQTGDIDFIAESVSATDMILQGGMRVGSAQGGGNVSLTTDSLDIENVNVIQGLGDLVIQPLAASTTIGLAGGNGTLNLNATELSKLADGFSSITVGRADGTGQVMVDAVTFNDPVTIVGGGVNLAGTLTANENPVELIANEGEISNARLFLVPNVDTSELRLTGTVTAADPTGTLAVDGDVVLSENDVVRIEIEGTNTIEFNRISATGDVTIEDNVELVTQPRGGFVPSIGDQFIIVDNLGANPINGVFAGLPEGARLQNFLGSSLDARITYQGGTGNEVALIVVDRTTLDFGDAPDSYQTLTSSAGPWHLATGPRLGALRDLELDGFPSTDATGDDSDGTDDEDGVMFGVVGVGMAMAGLNVDMQNAASAQIDAWIDFDADGVFQDDEQILTNRVVMQVGGIQTLNYTVNEDAVAGETVARVRVSSSGGLGVGGFAPDGEVEDYAITIEPRPLVDSVVVNGSEAQRSLLTELVVTFDSEVDAPAEAFEVRDRATGAVLDTLQVSNLVNGAGQTVSTLTFGAGGNLVFDRANGEHSLVDGNYVLAIDSSLIQLAGGGPTLESDIEFGTDDVDGFFRFFGDSDGDRDVDGQDFGRFAQSFPKTLGEDGFDPFFDSDGDDDVDGQDFGRFAANFLQTI